MVDCAPSFSTAVEPLNDWFGAPTSDFIWCSWGNYDLQHIAAESHKHGLAPRFLSRPHLNLRKIWRRTTGQKKKNTLRDALNYHGLTFEGQHHRGIDDARNIFRLLPFMDWSLEQEIRVPGFDTQGNTVTPNQ